MPGQTTQIMIKYILVIFLSFLLQLNVKAQKLNWSVVLQGDSTTLVSKAEIDEFDQIYLPGVFTKNVLLGNRNIVNTYKSYGFFLSQFDIRGNNIFLKSLPNNYSSNFYLNKKDGSFYLIGNFTYPTIFDPENNASILTPSGDSTTFIVKYSKLGRFEWVKKYKMPNAESLIQLNSIYLYYDKGFERMLARIDTSGNLMWSKTIFKYSNTSICRKCSYEIFNDNDNTIYINDCIEYCDTNYIDFNLGGPPLLSKFKVNMRSFIAKYDSSGKVISVLQQPNDYFQNGKSNFHYIKGHTTDNNGNLYSIATFSLETKLDTTLTAQTFISKGKNDILITRYNKNGTLNWARQLGGIDEDNIYSVSYLEEKGLIALTGSTGGMTVTTKAGTDLPLNCLGNCGFIIFYDTLGNLINLKKYGADFSFGVINKNRLFISGFFKGVKDIGLDEPHIITSEGYNKGFIASYDLSFIDGISEKHAEKYGINIFPNPASKAISIEAPDNISNLKVQILNIQGALIMDKSLSEEKILNIESLVQGLYLINIITPESTSCFKLFKSN